MNFLFGEMYHVLDFLLLRLWTFLMVSDCWTWSSMVIIKKLKALRHKDEYVDIFPHIFYWMELVLIHRLMRLISRCMSSTFSFFVTVENWTQSSFDFILVSQT